MAGKIGSEIFFLRFWQSNGKTKNGFTLIELLVVIAIIGILSSVAMTSLNGARAKARDAKRRSELKAIATAVEMYYYDHGGVYPVNSASGSGDWSATFKTQMAPYLSTFPVDPLNVSREYAAYRWGWGTSGCLGHYVVYGSLEKCDNVPLDGCGSSCLFAIRLEEY